MPAGGENEMQLHGRTLCDYKVVLNAISPRIFFFCFLLFSFFPRSYRLCILVISPEMKLYPILHSYSEKNLKSFTNNDGHKVMNLLPQAEKQA